MSAPIASIRFVMVFVGFDTNDLMWLNERPCDNYPLIVNDTSNIGCAVNMSSE